MRKIGKYESPEIEITKFEMARGIMAGVGEGGTGGDGDIVETSGDMESIQMLVEMHQSGQNKKSNIQGF